MRSSLALVAAALVAAASASAAAPAPRFLGCTAYFAKSQRVATIRPLSITVACGDAGLLLRKLRWSSWTATVAHATGDAVENDCSPNCAAGHFHIYAARVTLSMPRSCAGRLYFTRLALTYRGRSASQTYPAC